MSVCVDFDAFTAYVAQNVRFVLRNADSRVYGGVQTLESMFPLANCANTAATSRSDDSTADLIHSLLASDLLVSRHSLLDRKDAE